MIYLEAAGNDRRVEMKTDVEAGMAFTRQVQASASASLWYPYPSLLIRR